MERGGGGALAHAGLQHEELALLDGELDVHHVVEVVLQKHEDFLELTTRFLEAFHMLELGDGARVADARDDVFALGVYQVVTVEFLRAVGRVARERDARGRRVALVAEDHALHVDGGAQVVGDLVLLAVEDRTGVVPTAEHSLDGKLELHHRVLRELHGAVDDERRVFLARDVLGEDSLELRDELLQVFRGKVGVGLHAAHRLHGVDGVLEQVAVKPHDDVREHLDEAAIGVPREAGVLGLLDEAVDGLVVQAEVQNRIHHAGHRHGSTGTDGDEQRIFRIADLLSDTVLKIETILVDRVENAFRPYVAGVGVLHARLTGNRESRRNGKADVGHLGEVRALAAERRLHGGVALGYVVSLSVFAKRIDALHWFGHLVLLTSSGYLFTHDVGKRDLRRNISRTFP